MSEGLFCGLERVTVSHLRIMAFFDFARGFVDRMSSVAGGSPSQRIIASKPGRSCFFRCQLALNPACLANCRPIHTATNDWRWPAVDNKTYEKDPDALQHSLGGYWRNAYLAEIRDFSLKVIR